MLCEIKKCLINEYGEVVTPWSEETIPLAEFLLRLRVGEKISLAVSRKGKLLDLEGKVPFCNPFAICFCYPQYESVSFETIGGLIVMELTLNHVVQFLQEKPEFGKYLKQDEWYEPQLIVTHVLPGSVMQQSMSIVPGDIIELINDEPVSTLVALQKALPKSLKTGFLVVQTSNKILSVEKIDLLLAKEEMLCKNNDVPMSQVVRKMITHWFS